MEKLLIADDETNMTKLLNDYFSRENCTVLIANDGMSALQLFKDNADDIDICVFDYMMPGINGIELCKMVKSIRAVPVAIFTAKTEEEVQLLAFDNLADEYISKPFSLKVLQARLERLINIYKIQEDHYAENNPDIVMYGDLKINIASHSAKILSQELQLSPLEFELLHILAKNANKVMSFSDIITCLYGDPNAADAKTVNQYIIKLREKINFQKSRKHMN